MTLPSNLADFSSALVWRVSIILQISNSLSLSSKPLQIVPSAPIMVNIISYTIHCGSLFPPIRAWSWILFVLVCRICLLLIVSSLFFAQATLVILLRIIYFRFNIIGPYGVVLYCYKIRYSFSFEISSFVAIPPCSRVRTRQFVSWNIHTVVFSYNFCFLVWVLVIFLFVLLLPILLL